MFFAGLPQISNQINLKLQNAYRQKRIFYFMQTYEFQQTFIIDISETFETKINDMFAYQTQFYNEISTESETFIFKMEFIIFLEARAKIFGFIIGDE